MIDSELFKKKDAILKLRDKVKDVGRAGKRNLEKEWYRNILFLVGRQWIVFDKTKKRWADWQSPSWYEKPVTNKFAVCHNTIKTVLTQEDPRVIVRPESDSEEDQATAEVAEMAVDVVTEESDMKTVKEIAASWNVATGNCFLHNYYEVSGPKYGESFIQHEMCANEECREVYRPTDLESGKCEKCGGTDFQPALDQHLQPYGEMVPKGKLCCDAVPPFEMFFNAEVQNFKELTEVVRSKVVPLDLAKEMFPEHAEKITSISPGEATEQTYMKAIAYVNNTSGSQEMMGGAGGDGKSESATIDYLFSLPTKDFPEGLDCTIIGDEIVELADLKYKNRKKKHFIPMTHIGNERVPGRIWHKTKLDDVAYKQIERNKLQSYILLWIYSMSGGKWIEADGINMDRPTGQPNQVLKYTRGPSGEKPELVNGLQIPGQLLQLLEMIDNDIEDLAGSYDVLKGQLPAGLGTASGLRMLTERAFSRHNEMIRNWEGGLEDNTIMQLEIARLFFTEERKKTFENDLGNWETKTFTNADLQGGVDVKIEPGSTIPRSKAAEDEAISHSIAEGIVNPMDPKVNFKILEKRGQTDLASSVGEDIKDATHEWKDFMDSVQENEGDPQKWKIRPRNGIDNEQVHYLDAIARAKTDEFFALPIDAQTQWIEHALYHKMNMDMEMQAKAMAAMPPKDGGSPVSGGGKMPSTLSPAPVNVGTVA